MGLDGWVGPGGSTPGHGEGWAERLLRPDVIIPVLVALGSGLGCGLLWPATAPLSGTDTALNAWVIAWAILGAIVGMLAGLLGRFGLFLVWLSVSWIMVGVAGPLIWGEDPASIEEASGYVVFFYGFFVGAPASAGFGLGWIIRRLRGGVSQGSAPRPTPPPGLRSAAGGAAGGRILNERARTVVRWVANITVVLFFGALLANFALEGRLLEGLLGLALVLFVDALPVLIGVALIAALRWILTRR